MRCLLIVLYHAEAFFSSVELQCEETVLRKPYLYILGLMK